MLLVVVVDVSVVAFVVDVVVIIVGGDVLSFDLVKLFAGSVLEVMCWCLIWLSFVQVVCWIHFGGDELAFDLVKFG